MSDVLQAVSLAKIHAYVDNQLNNADCEIIEAYFDSNPDKFEELQQYLAINDYCHATYDSILGEPIPEYMLDRMYADSGDPFGQQKYGNSPFVKKILSKYLSKDNESAGFNRPSLKEKIVDRLYVLLQLERFEDKQWLQNLRQKFLNDSRLERTSPLRETLTQAVKKTRLHPQTAPSWLNKLITIVSPVFDKIYTSFRGMNIFFAASAIAVGIAFGLTINSTQPLSSGLDPSDLVDLQAIKAHDFYAAEGRPLLNTDSEGKAQLIKWISSQLQQEIQLFDFDEMGFTNIGLSVMPTGSSYAFVTTYENDKLDKLTLYASVVEKSGGKVEFRRPPVCSEPDNFSMCSWINKKLKFVVVSDLPLSQTKQIIEWIMQNQAMAHRISWHAKSKIYG